MTKILCVFALLLLTPAFAVAKGPAKTKPAVKAEVEVEEDAEAPTRALRLSDLTTEEIKVYQYGEISSGSHVAGGLIGTFFGLGLGHIVYGKYADRGWIFTVSELAAVGIMAAGAVRGIADCSFGNRNGCSNGVGLYVLGALAWTGLRIWEIVDVWTIPGNHNSEYRAIKTKLGGPAEELGVRWNLVPLVVPAGERTLGYGLGLSAKF